jgi:hypothetical protein
MPHGGPHALAGEFINRRTGALIPEGTPYHLHQGQAMEGAFHNTNIDGGVEGHDFFDRVNGGDNMPHTPGHTNGNAPFMVYGTNEPYSGMTVEIGGKLYTTRGGTLEGDSQQLVPNQGFIPNQDMDILNNANNPNTNNGSTQQTSTITTTNTTTTNNTNSNMGGGISY